MPASLIALDVGGTAMKGAVLEGGLRITRTMRRPTPRGSDAQVAAVGDTLEELIAWSRAAGDIPAAAGVVVPGLIDEDSGRAILAANLDWRDVPLRQLLSNRTGLPVAIGHDVRAGGLAEATLGAGRGSRNVLFVPVGTGIAAALIVDGRTLVADGYAGEIGHLAVDPGGEPCGCGGRGCLETVASAGAVARRYRVRNGRAVDGAVDVAARLPHDPVAVEVWESAVDHLAGALLSAVTLLGPEVIVVGGGLAEAGDALLQPLAKRIFDRLSFQRRPRVVKAELGDLAGCLGAGLLARDSARRRRALASEHHSGATERSVVRSEERSDWRAEPDNGRSR